MPHKNSEAVVVDEVEALEEDVEVDVEDMVVEAMEDPEVINKVVMAAANPTEVAAAMEVAKEDMVVEEEGDMVVMVVPDTEEARVAMEEEEEHKDIIKHLKFTSLSPKPYSVI